MFLRTRCRWFDRIDRLEQQKDQFDESWFTSCLLLKVQSAVQPSGCFMCTTQEETSALPWRPLRLWMISSRFTLGLQVTLTHSHVCCVANCVANSSDKQLSPSATLSERLKFSKNPGNRSPQLINSKSRISAEFKTFKLELHELEKAGNTHIHSLSLSNNKNVDRTELFSEWKLTLSVHCNSHELSSSVHQAGLTSFCQSQTHTGRTELSSWCHNNCLNVVRVVNNTRIMKSRFNGKLQLNR